MEEVTVTSTQDEEEVEVTFLVDVLHNNYIYLRNTVFSFKQNLITERHPLFWE